MSADSAASSLRPQPFLVALAAWLLPGLGYALIGEKLRGAVIGVAIVFLFVFGLLVGGVRSLEVPRYDSHGRFLPNVDLLSEVRTKPWSIAQVMNGPIAIAGGWGSVWAARIPEGETEPRGVESHARVNEIAILYTAVAGMLNLLAIIDSAHRAGRLLEQRPAGQRSPEQQ